MSPAEIKLDRTGPVLTVTLCRGDRDNSLSPTMTSSLAATWQEVKTDPDVRAIIITGEGDRAFCTGMDVPEHVARGGHQDWSKYKLDDFALTPHQAGVWKPVIIAVNGTCSAGGLHFLCDPDVIVASDTASFFDDHIELGQVAALEPIGLIARIGLGNALRLITLGPGAPLSAADALRISLVDEIVAPSKLIGRAMALAQLAAKGSPTAFAISKQAIWGAINNSLQAGLEAGWARLVAHQAHPDCHEGPVAHVEQRAPRWTVE